MPWNHPANDRRYLIERLVREITKFDDEFRREEAESAVESPRRALRVCAALRQGHMPCPLCGQCHLGQGRSGWCQPVVAGSNPEFPPSRACTAGVALRARRLIGFAVVVRLSK